jgi:hypothetical protein
VEAALIGEPLTKESIAAASQAAAELAERDPAPPDPGPTPYPPAIPPVYRQRLAAAVVAEALTTVLARAQGGDGA